ncbi:MAG TPA: RNA 3'-terminal phosphate cyclase [Nostocaceae cyanobacterium]|nr:RNA 3'-terminal phosphate cyclase [Nostocaceae cyanobacterium]
MLEIDGSYGEGGGQVLRSSLSLAVITGTPIRLVNIRARRDNPGIAAQHLTSIRAAAQICQAQVTGDALGSKYLEFIPGSSVKTGNYTFDVREILPTGSAGAVTLILQTILLPLALASGDSKITLKGGTHVNYSPTFTYIQEVYLPILNQMGIKSKIQLNSWGWYPQGRGEVEIEINGNCHLKGINLLERGNLKQVQGLAVATNLPAHISQRMANRAGNVLREEGLKVHIQTLRARGLTAGAGIFLTAKYEYSVASFFGLGRVGIAAEKVADFACEQLLNFHYTNAPIDEHLADQLLLPAALAAGESHYRVSDVTGHLTTNGAVIEKFGLARINVDKQEKIVRVTPIKN